MRLPGLPPWIRVAHAGAEGPRSGTLIRERPGSIDGFSFDVLVEQNSWSPTVGMHALPGEHQELTVEGGFEPRRSAMFMLGLPLLSRSAEGDADMSLMKVRERQQKSPAAKEFRRVPNQGRAVLFAGAALVLAGAAVWIFVGDDQLVAGLLLPGVVVSSALSYNHRRGSRNQD